MEFVKKYLYDDKELHVEVAKLKNNFMNNAQALIMVIFIQVLYSLMKKE